MHRPVIMTNLMTRDLMMEQVWFYEYSQSLAKFPHSPILHYACRSLLTENNGKNNTKAVRLCAVFVVGWWGNKALQTLNRMHNEVWGCAEI